MALGCALTVKYCKKFQRNSELSRRLKVKMKFTKFQPSWSSYYATGKQVANDGKNRGKKKSVFCWLQVEKAAFIQEDAAVGCNEVEPLGAPTYHLPV